MPPLVLQKLLARAEAGRTYVHAVSGLANRVRALHAHGMREIARACVAFNLHARFSNRCGHMSGLEAVAQ